LWPPDNPQFAVRRQRLKYLEQKAKKYTEVRQQKIKKKPEKYQKK